MASKGSKTAVAKTTGPKHVPTTVRDFFSEDPHFQTNWQDFDKVKDAMFKESRDLWKQMDKDFRQMRCMRDNVMLGRDAEPDTDGGPVQSLTTNPLEKYESGWMFPRRWMLPSMKTPLSQELELFKPEHDHEVIRVKEDDKQLEVSLDTSHYRPDELHVSVHDGQVEIDGRHVEKSEDGKRTLTRSFKRKYTLPEGAKAENVSSNLSSDGVLVIKALKGNPVTNVEIKQIK
uniref:Heat shock protein beta-1 n=1 Tax=Acartia pacifica TaxID=335913 RepID=R9TIM3_ACAPC|nr:heat shock protein beta-1 [Acartia pacifica]